MATAQQVREATRRQIEARERIRQEAERIKQEADGGTASPDVRR